MPVTLSDEDAKQVLPLLTQKKNEPLKKRIENAINPPIQLEIDVEFASVTFDTGSGNVPPKTMEKLVPLFRELAERAKAQNIRIEVEVIGDDDEDDDDDGEDEPE